MRESARSSSDVVDHTEFNPRAPPRIQTGPDRPIPQGKVTGTVFGKHWQPTQRDRDMVMNDAPNADERILNVVRHEYARSNSGAFRTRPPSTNSRNLQPYEQPLPSSPPLTTQLHYQTDNRNSKNPYNQLAKTGTQRSARVYPVKDKSITMVPSEQGDDNDGEQWVRKRDLEDIMKRCFREVMEDAARQQRQQEEEEENEQQRQQEAEENERLLQRDREEAERAQRGERALNEQRRERERLEHQERERVRLATEARRQREREAAEQDGQQRHDIEAERIRRTTAREEELREWAERNNRTYRPAARGPPNGFYDYPPREERPEHIKPELIGYLDPIATHLPWDGSPTAPDKPNTYISFAAWLSHVKAVLSQKPSIPYKRAVLDTASLHCLRGAALEWWTALDDNQQQALREDVELNLWPVVGGRLSKRNHAGRKDAMNRKRQVGETLVTYATVKLRMLKEAFPADREVRDVIKDIRDGLSVQDQLAIREDMSSWPTIPRLMEELQRMDEIKAEEFRTAYRALKTPGNQTGRQVSNDTGRKNQNTGNKRNPRPPFVYEPSKIKYKVDPKNPSGPKVRTYEFNDGKVIWLQLDCKHCGAKHFNFECNKRPSPGAARAAPMQVDDSEDAVGYYMTMPTDSAPGDTRDEEGGGGPTEEYSVWDTSEAWDESSYASLLAEN